MRKVRTERFLAKRHVALAAVLLLMPLVAGCPQEVPYAAPEQGAPEAGTPATDEAPAFSPDDSAAPDPSTEQPAPAETAVNEPAAAAPGGAPWEAANKSAAPPEGAGDLFAAVDKPAETAAKPPAASEVVEEKKKSDDSGFGDFLDDAYGSTVTEEPAAETPAEVAEPQPAEEELATSTPPSKPPAATVDDLWGAPASTPAADTPPPAETPPAVTAVEPKAPSATASSNADLLDELWGEEPETPAETTEQKPTPVPAIEPPAEKVEVNESPTIPLDEPSKPATQESLFDEPKTEVEPDVEPEVTEPLPPPDTAELDVAETDAFDNDALDNEAAEQPAIERAAPMAADAMKPLPEVPVLEFNTRHLAWLLGGKLGLAELADLDGATASEVAEWRSEVARLAKSLRIADPSTGGAATDADKRVQDMLAAASRSGAELTRTHGVDHAALLEIALKTNALLVVAKEHPDLAGSVGSAVEGAAERAMLPKFLWEDSVRVLKASPDADQAHDAVVRLHQRVESFLR